MACVYEGLDQIYLFFYYYTMEKLLQLLNEYQNSYKSKFIFSDYDEKTTSFSLVNSEMCLWAETIISKKFWFIERLVSNKKLNLIDFKEVVKEVEFTDNEEFDRYIFYSITDSLLMLLAISDDPISFLVSILK